MRMSAGCHRAASTMSSSSPYSSWRSRAVPAYRRTGSAGTRGTGGPGWRTLTRRAATPGSWCAASRTSSRIAWTRFGVVVTKICGCGPRRVPIRTLSQAVAPESSGRWLRAAISSTHVQCDCGPRNWDGFSDENVRAWEPLGQIQPAQRRHVVGHERRRGDGEDAGVAADHHVPHVGDGAADEVPDRAGHLLRFLVGTMTPRPGSCRRHARRASARSGRCREGRNWSGRSHSSGSSRSSAEKSPSSRSRSSGSSSAMRSITDRLRRCRRRSRDGELDAERRHRHAAGDHERDRRGCRRCEPSARCFSAHSHSTSASGSICADTTS